MPLCPPEHEEEVALLMLAKLIHQSGRTSVRYYSDLKPKIQAVYEAFIRAGEEPFGLFATPANFRAIERLRDRGVHTAEQYVGSQLWVTKGEDLWPWVRALLPREVIEVLEPSVQERQEWDAKPIPERPQL